MSSSTSNQGGVHSFLGRLHTAEQKVREKSNGNPQLWHATATSSSGKPVDDVWGLDNIDAVFIVDGKRIYVLQEQHWSEYKDPVEKGEFSGDFTHVGVVKTLPLPIGAAEAEHTMRQLTKSKEKVKSVELAWRLTRFTSDQPYYFFVMADGSRHAVGGENGKMATED